MHFRDVDGRRYAQFESLRDEPGLRHAFSTRPIDVAMRRDADAPARAARRRTMAVDLGLDPERMYCCVQIHEPRLSVIEPASPPGEIENTDGLLSAATGAALMTFSADCPLVLAFDPRRRVLGMVHASWRCTVAGAATRLVGALVEHFDCVAADLRTGVGPSAGPCCYEVGPDVYAAAAVLPDRDRLFSSREGRMHFDLWRANRAQLVAAGVRPESVELAEICTMCQNESFFSYRREGAGCGHFGLMAGLVGE